MISIRGERRRPKDRRIEKLLKWESEASLKAVEPNRQRYLARFEDDLRVGDHRSVVADLSRLGESALYPSGAQAVLQGNQGGWIDVEQTVFYRALPIVVNEVLTAQSGVVVAHLLATDRFKLAQAVAMVLDRDMQQDPDRWAGRYFSQFVMRFLRQRRESCGEAPLHSVPARVLGPFQPIVDAWTNPLILREALTSACEYHLTQTSLTQNIGEFSVYYDLIPIELAAIRTVRAAEGIETPPVDHPLTSTPFARIPDGPQYNPDNDELWQRTRRLLKENMPDLDLGV